MYSIGRREGGTGKVSVKYLDVEQKQRRSVLGASGQAYGGAREGARLLWILVI